MRQSGLLAAAAMYGLSHHRERLSEDHRLAQKLATGIAECPGIEIDLAGVQTNIVYFTLRNTDANSFQQQLDDAGIRLLAIGPSMMRAVVSLAVDEAGIDRALKVIKGLAKQGQTAA